MGKKVRENFEYTGRNIQIDSDTSSLQVIALLDEYKKRLNKGESPNSNPFKQKIIMRHPSGKYYEIPEDIQKKAIKIWLARNRKNNIDIDGDDAKKTFAYIFVVLGLVVFGYLLLKKCENCTV